MNYKHLVLGGLLFAAAPQLLAQSVTAGIDAWRKQDYAGAVAIWRPLAEKGDADAAFNLGQAYRLGRGATLNLSAAQTWFERAARQGHVDAQTTLGLLLFQNGNQTAGLRWLKGAAERGDARAMLIYGTALFNGDGIAQDPVLGYTYVSRAAAQGLAPAKQTLEQMDQVMPLEDRKKGLAIAMAKAKAAPPAPAAPKKTVKAAAVKVPAKPATVQAKPVTKVPAPAAATGAWRIQLGAFSQRSSAEALYRKLSGSLGGRQAYYVAAGPVTRLQVGPYESKAAAAAACRAVAQACFPVAGK
jgi:TPR repeat protein